jgi:predicted DNA-binding transcriptional regulator AlpA
MRILRLRGVMRKTGLGRSSIYKFSKLGKFPESTRLGGSVGWSGAKLDLWIAQRIRDRDSAPHNAIHVSPWSVALTADNLSDSALHIIRIEQVVKMTGLARSTVYKYIKEWDFPLPITLTGTCKGWLEAEISHWLATVELQKAPFTINQVAESPNAD